MAKRPDSECAVEKDGAGMLLGGGRRLAIYKAPKPKPTPKPTPGPGWAQWFGCYTDDRNRDLKFGPKKYGYTMQTCKAACKQYKYMALQANGWCNCDNTVGTHTTGKYSKRNSRECGKPCRNDRKFGPHCGGLWRNAVYLTGTTPKPAVAHFVGCYMDDRGRDLKFGPRKYGYTMQTCAATCKQYKYIALQANGWCNCDNSVGTPGKYRKRPDSECGVPCKKNAELGPHCGGSWRNAVYLTAATPAPTPTPTPAPTPTTLTPAPKPAPTKDPADAIGEREPTEVACSARLLHAKRKLDKLLKETNTLTSEVNGHKTIIKTENENLKVTKLAMETVESDYGDAIKVCNKQKEAALADLKQYSAELTELEQIAKQGSGNALIQQQSLLQVNDFTREQCLAFIEFAKTHSGKVTDPKDCEKEREELQKAFTKAYKEVSDLKNAARKRSEDKSCFEDAKAEKIAKLTPLTSQREKCTSKIESSTTAIASLEPVVENLSARIKKLKHKIQKELMPECSEADEASKMLKQIRGLIIALKECPGRGNFTLAIPKEKSLLEQAEPEEVAE